ncbi:glycosyltransferase family 4 protein [Marinospirillum alkaliphilum]|uniref:Glycosyltransferase involved in cell wall bisynthesis n=1 Tax=Marinospirillum alkaliphilum DSM 21637 TaxID=1122209 RepID=A0A1K1Y3A3_9GAMM|nr:glycosyltransferase family 1 protein [Marinospirillum alkaliphilum]SFX56367.1 Glycosyltransferase involved in cell wall bisynthesis [Marinospirillum alkaliphilum DSM 21637]
MRLALVTETFVPDVNGVALTLDHLSRGVLRHGVQVDLVCPGHGAGVAAERLQYWQAAGHSLPGYPQLRFGWRLPERVLQQWQLTPPDAFYIATEGPLGWHALSYARRHGIPVISGYHTNFEQYLQHYRLGWLKGLARRYLRWFHNASNLTLTPCRQQQQLLQAEGYQRVQVLGRGVDTRLFSPTRRCNDLREQLGVRPEQLLVGYVGRVAAEKNLPLLLQAFAAIRAQRSDARLLLVGDGPWMLEVRKACPDVLLVGNQRGESLARHYACMDLFLFPSLTETWGNVVGEALASGLPVVAFDRAAASELIRDQENGCLIPCQSTQRDILFVARSVALAVNDQQLLAMGHRATQGMQGQGWEQISESFYRLLQTSLNKAPGHESKTQSVRRFSRLDRKA